MKENNLWIMIALHYHSPAHSLFVVLISISYSDIGQETILLEDVLLENCLGNMSWNYIRKMVFLKKFFKRSGMFIPKLIQRTILIHSLGMTVFAYIGPGWTCYPAYLGFFLHTLPLYSWAYKARFWGFYIYPYKVFYGYLCLPFLLILKFSILKQ